MGVETVGGSTASNTSAVAGRAAGEVLSQIDAATAQAAANLDAIDAADAQIADLLQTYGDTASAAASAQAAQAAATAAETAQSAAQTASSQAAQAVTSAEQAASSATSQALLSAASATAAAGSATTSSAMANQAAGSASAAAGSATAAQTSAGSASVDAGQAASSSTTAQQAAATATTQASLASESAGAASTSATAAAASQTAAGQSASAAATSATNAATSEGDASTSAGQASTSASSAAGSANTAGTYATNAANSAGASGISASASNTSATAASSSASAASGFASTAQSYYQQAQVQAGNSANSASSASSSAAAASTSATAAQQSYFLAATVGSGALNANPTFAAYAGTGSIPSGWEDDSYGTGASYRNAGFDSPNCIGFDCMSTYAGDNVQISQQPYTAGASYGLSFVGSGWYVLEVDVYVHSQTSASSAAAFVAGYTQGAGQGPATAQAVVTLGTTPDINGQVGVLGGRRQYALLAQLNCASAGVTIQSNGAYGVTASSNIEWHKVLLRPASQAEIDGHQALLSANTNTATLSSFQSAQASQNSAFSTSLTTLNAAVFNAAGGSLQSQISNASATQATQAATFASQISTLQAQVTINPNLCPNGGFANGWNSGWLCFTPHNVYQDPQFGTLAYTQFTSGGGGVAIQSSAIPCVANRQYCLSGNIQCVDANGNFYACYLDRVYYNASNQVILDGDQNTQAYALNLSSPDYSFAEVAPSNAATMAIRLVYNAPSGVAVTAYIQRVKLEVGPVYTGWSDDASTATLTATVTQSSAAIATLQGQLFASYTLTATAGNVITGLQLLSASGATTISAVVFQAENFLIKSASAGSSVSPFAYNSSTGTLLVQNVAISGNLIVDGTILSPQLALGAVTSFYFAYSDATTPISGASSAPIVSPPPTGAAALAAEVAAQPPDIEA